MTPPKPPRPAQSSLEDELRQYLADQKSADLLGTVNRLADMFLQHEAKHAEAHIELKGDIRGVSLRVGALEKRSERQEDDIEDSKRWILADLKEQRDHARGHLEWLKKNSFAIIASLVALASTIWHLFR